MLQQFFEHPLVSLAIMLAVYWCLERLFGRLERRREERAAKAKQLQKSESSEIGVDVRNLNR